MDVQEREIHMEEVTQNTLPHVKRLGEFNMLRKSGL